MSKVLAYRLVPVVGIEAVDVLPRVACLAVYCVSVIVREVADTLDGVRLFLHRLYSVGGGLVLDDGCHRRGRSGLTGNCGLRRQRRRPVCHNLRRASRGELALEGVSELITVAVFGA